MNIARTFLLAALAALPPAVVACGASNAGTPPQQPASSASASASASFDSPEVVQKAAITNRRAGQLAASAAAWRRANGGCPTIKDLTDKYTLEPNVETDASGAPFTIECTNDDVRVHTADGAVARTEPYKTRATASTYAPLPSGSAPPAGAGADQVMRGMASQFRRCYNAALRNDPNASGSVHGTVVIAKEGTVKEVIIDPQATTVKDASLIACITNVIKSAHFDPSPDGSEARITF